jgi:hypothetical protein
MRRTLTFTVTLAAAVVLAGFVGLAAQDAEKIDVTGKWIADVQTSAGSGTPTFTFKQDGEKLTGHYSGQLGEADLTGSVKGKEISYSFGVDVQGTHIDVTYAGTVESRDSMKGTVKLGGVGEGTFTAKRQ